MFATMASPLTALLAIFSSSTLFLLLLLTCCFLYKNFLSPKKNLPLGPSPWRLIGNLPQFLTAKTKGPWIYKVLEDFNAGIACIRIGNVHVIPVSCPKIALEIVEKQDALFASRPKTMATALHSRDYLRAAFAPHGEQWKKMRRVLVSELLSPDRHRWFHDKRTTEADNLVKWIYNLQRDDNNRPVNLRTVTRHYGVNVTRKVVFGRRYFGPATQDGGPGVAEQEHAKAIWQSLGYFFSFAISDYFPFLTGLDLDGHEKYSKEAFDIFKKCHDPIIEERIRKWWNGDAGNEKLEIDDFLDVMITLKDSSGRPALSVEEIKAQIAEVFVEVSDNPANCVEWAMAELINQPRLLQKAVEEMDEVVGKDRLVQEFDIPKLHFLKACAREIFRLHPVSQFIPTHLATADTTVAGYFIPKGSHIHLSRLGLGRNPKVWDNPLVFDPERHARQASMPVLTDPTMRFLSFGLGRRGCVARNLGTVMTLMLLGRLVQRFDWKVKGRSDLRESEDSLALGTPLEACASPRQPLHLYEAI